ncbi:helix-turn-helix transcriptional regulator [Anaerospora sp.]|uniref:helix-turn-helix transcriptional regulator n=1 Tax=Anaerospora sp. TaxID=1960278 RepID=UPI0028A03FEA|nr:helix-turn-helix transcriptional regulator [Anaerospora sp.]
MSDTNSYTPEEVSNILKISKYTVYEMIKRGDLAAYHIGRKVRVQASDLDHYIQKSKGASSTAVSKQVDSPPASQDSLIICGQDVVLDILTRHLEREFPQIKFLRNYVGSMDGLLALYRGTANVATAHLWDSDTGNYNSPYIRRILPGHKALLINLVHRNAGFYVAKGNPKGIFSWKDLTRPDVRIINRECGSGARVLLDEQLRKLSLSTKDLQGYSHIEMSHLAVASTVARGDADVGIGIEKAAQQVQGVDFIPLQVERYDIVIRKDDADKPLFQALLTALRSKAFINEVQGIGGYDLSKTGQIVDEV